MHSSTPGYLEDTLPLPKINLEALLWTTFTVLYCSLEISTSKIALKTYEIKLPIETFCFLCGLPVPLRLPVKLGEDDKCFFHL